MTGKLIIITGASQLVRQSIFDYIEHFPLYFFLPNKDDSIDICEPKSVERFVDLFIKNEITRNEILLNTLAENKNIIVEQWYIGILSKAMAWGIVDVDDLIIQQIIKFNKFNKYIIYISTDIEKLPKDSLFEQRRKELLELDKVINNLNLNSLNVDGEMSHNNINERLVYILRNINSQ